MKASTFNFSMFAGILANHYGSLVDSPCGGDQFAGSFMAMFIERSTSLKNFEYADSSYGKFLLGSRRMSAGKIRQIYNARSIRKFGYFINDTKLTEETKTALLRDLKQAVKNSVADKEKKKALLALANDKSVDKFAFALFEYALEKELEGPKRRPAANNAAIETSYITEHSKRAVRRFIGRTTEMDDIKGLLQSDQTQAIWIHGMGGLGKTQLCRKLFSDFDGNFPFWG